MNFLNSIQSKLHGAVNPNSVQYIKQQDLQVQLDPSGTAYVDHGNQAFSLNVDDENTTALAILDKAPSTQPLSLSGQSQFTICLKHKVQDASNPLIGQYYTNPQYDLSLSSTTVGTLDTFQVNVFNASDDPVSYSITGELTSADLSNADLTGTITNLYTPLSYTLRSGYGDFVFSLDGLSQQVTATVYQKYWIKSVTNLLGELVFGFSSTGSTGDYLNQPDISFGQGGKYMFDVSDPTMTDLSLVFGTTVDNLSTVNDSVVTRTNDLVILDISSGYTGNRLVYFEDSSAGMGYYFDSGSSSLSSTLYKNTEALTPAIGTTISRTDTDVSNLTISLVDNIQYPFANGDYTISLSSRYINTNQISLAAVLDEDPPTEGGIYNQYMYWEFRWPCYAQETNGAPDANCPTTTASNGNSYTGEYIQLVMPYKTTLESTNLMTRTADTTYKPNEIVLLGKNSGSSTFDYIGTKSNIYSELSGTQKTFTFNSTTPYDTYRIVVTRAYGYVQMGIWSITGYPMIPSVPETYTVTVDGDPVVFYLDNESGPTPKPAIDFANNSGTTYIFDQSDSTNANNTLVIGTAPDISSSIVSSGLTIMGTPGQPGAYTKYVSDGTPVYYFSYQTSNMGYS